MTEIQRIRLTKAMGLKLPPNTVKVGYGTRWASPYDSFARVPLRSTRDVSVNHAIRAARGAAQMFRHKLLTDGKWMAPGNRYRGPVETTLEDVRRELRGKNLACQCGLDMPCHGDVLMEFANDWPTSPIILGPHYSTAALDAAIEAVQARFKR